MSPRVTYIGNCIVSFVSFPSTKCLPPLTLPLLCHYNPEASTKHSLLPVTIIRPHLLSTPVSLITLPGKWPFITQVSFMVFRHITIIITYLRRGTMLITSVCFPTTKTVLKYRKHLQIIDQLQCTSTSNKKLEHYISGHF